MSFVQIVQENYRKTPTQNKESENPVSRIDSFSITVNYQKGQLQNEVDRELAIKSIDGVIMEFLNTSNFKCETSIVLVKNLSTIIFYVAVVKATSSTKKHKAIQNELENLKQASNPDNATLKIFQDKETLKDDLINNLLSEEFCLDQTYHQKIPVGWVGARHFTVPNIIKLLNIYDPLTLLLVFPDSVSLIGNLSVLAFLVSNYSHNNLTNTLINENPFFSSFQEKISGVEGFVESKTKIILEMVKQRFDNLENKLDNLGLTGVPETQVITKNQENQVIQEPEFTHEKLIFNNVEFTREEFEILLDGIIEKERVRKREASSKYYKRNSDQPTSPSSNILPGENQDHYVIRKMDEFETQLQTMGKAQYVKTYLIEKEKRALNK